MDSVNSDGETAFETATTGDSIILIQFNAIFSKHKLFLGVAEIILRTQSKLCLKCIAAKAIKRYSIDYKGLLPVTLEGFIELHGSGTIQR